MAAKWFGQARAIPITQSPDTECLHRGRGVLLTAVGVAADETRPQEKEVIVHGAPGRGGKGREGRKGGSCERGSDVCRQGGGGTASRRQPGHWAGKVQWPFSQRGISPDSSVTQGLQGEGRPPHRAKFGSQADKSANTHSKS